MLGGRARPLRGRARPPTSSCCATAPAGPRCCCSCARTPATWTATGPPPRPVTSSAARRRTTLRTARRRGARHHRPRPGVRDLHAAHPARRARSTSASTSSSPPGRGAGEPRIVEPDKCAELRWCPLDALPDPVVPHERIVLDGLRRRTGCRRTHVRLLSPNHSAEGSPQGRGDPVAPTLPVAPASEDVRRYGGCSTTRRAVIARTQAMEAGLPPHEIRRLLRPPRVGARASRRLRRPHRPADLAPASLGGRAVRLAGGAWP